jgi:hypothetical protein
MHLGLATKVGRLQSDIVTLESTIGPDGRTFPPLNGCRSAIPLVK